MLADLAGQHPEVVAAERVAREVSAGDGHGGQEHRTAWDVLVHLRRVLTLDRSRRCDPGLTHREAPGVGGMELLGPETLKV